MNMGESGGPRDGEEQGTAQRTEAVLTSEDDVAALGAALGWNEPQSVDELRDVSGRLLVSGGQPQPEFQELLGLFTEQRAAVSVFRTDSSGTGPQHMLWMGPRGILWSEPHQDTVRLQSASGGTSFRVLIDLLDLKPRPAPRPGFDPVRISPQLLSAAVNHQAGPDGPAGARAEVAEKVRDIAPQIADCLQIGDADLVTFAAEWDSAQGPRAERLMYFDTPAGMLFHSADTGFTGQKHYLEPSPSWLVWAKIVSRLPVPEDIEYWMGHGG